MTEGRRLSNRSSIRNTTHIFNDTSSKTKGTKFKFKNGSGTRQSPNKQHISSSPPILEVQNIADVDTSNTFGQFNRISQPPSKNLNYDTPKINVKLEYHTMQSSKIIYKIDVPISSKSDMEISPVITKLINETHESAEAFKLCNDNRFGYTTLDALPAVLSKYISQNMSVQRLPQRPKTKHLYNRVDQLLAQENQFFSANDSIELSFDGKAMNKNDIFRIVDSFSVAFDDDEYGEDGDDEYVKQPRNILTREVTGVF
ncbi:uncharacterized protein KLLA0_C06292g [Kluyveromyces lactis]|uniref:KLLA0C06292p n=1 Tax=Kluyveromyces lactis (strain ATCC 8585 / CBS 2359 / DSM 70799 / NBRC 1267 / NRRL Y-1140 / WM37) TaxID=284590 RepID=Q6CUB1_KLULA|nr:uncharacterized protein KLLA0_C06292g [Kluyveromyces lactis]CAH01329.1 KLLA0C06292p [Kluyveromyces lactis]|eukprot:XP_452478.1 uncharacterized protein KLLA0_C06292g [Kluyveromyces lactis]